MKNCFGKVKIECLAFKGPLHLLRTNLMVVILVFLLFMILLLFRLLGALRIPQNHRNCLLKHYLYFINFFLRQQVHLQSLRNHQIHRLLLHPQFQGPNHLFLIFMVRFPLIALNPHFPNHCLVLQNYQNHHWILHHYS